MRFLPAGFIVFFFGLAASHEEIYPPSRGNCPNGWLDGSLVNMGYEIPRSGYGIITILFRCLLFNSTEGMTWLDSIKYCKSVTNVHPSYHPTSSLVEILTVEV